MSCITYSPSRTLAMARHFPPFFFLPPSWTVLSQTNGENVVGMKSEIPPGFDFGRVEGVTGSAVLCNGSLFKKRSTSAAV